MNEKTKTGRKSSMKIVAGLGSIDEYIRFCEAGADEFFAGYVPYEWSRKYGSMLPLNRREVLTSNVQLGSFSELEILAEMVKTYGRPVHLTFNALSYSPQQYPEVAEIISRCTELGFQNAIVADPALICYLRSKKAGCGIHVSGELGEVNSRMLSVFLEQKIQRLIFHRKCSFAEMKSVIQNGKKNGENVEYEAFALNELCQYTGAFCNSLHCDEMGYLCRVPHHLGPVKRGGEGTTYGEGGAACGRKPNMADTECGTCGRAPDTLTADGDFSGDLPYGEDGYLCGATGCGLCALYQLREAGITHMKLVGRGNYTDFMERDIRNLKRALTLLAESGSEEGYKETMKRELFPKGCSGNCYYREPV